MIIDIKTFEEMTPMEQRLHLQALIEDEIVFDQDGGGVSLEEFLDEVSPAEILRHQKTKKGYFKLREIAKLTGLHRDTLQKRFHGKPGVKEQTFAGRGRTTYHTMIVSKAAAEKEFPNIVL
jgi:hypothetical protein